MCTIALMGTKSIRIHNAPTALIAQAKAAAAMQGVTLREWIMDAMQTRLEDAPDAHIRGTGSSQAGAPERSGNGDAMPVLPETKGKAKRLHPVQSMRSELAAGRGHNKGSESEPHKDHITYKAGDKQYCSDCRVVY
jgi:hypothetical protein